MTTIESEGQLSLRLQKLSVVVPVFNECESLEQLVEEIAAGVGSGVAAFEIILIDDGSTDDSWSAITRLARARAWVSGIRLRRSSVGGPPKQAL